MNRSKFAGFHVSHKRPLCLLQSLGLYTLMVKPQQFQRTYLVMLFSGRARLVALYLRHQPGVLRR